MAQLSEPLAREAIRRIRAGHMHGLTANEIDQALWAWLMLNGHEPRPRACRCNHPDPAKCIGVPWGQTCECKCHAQETGTGPCEHDFSPTAALCVKCGLFP